MQSSWLEQLCGKAIRLQIAEKLQLGSSLLPAFSPLSPYPALITAQSLPLCIQLLGDRVCRR